MPSKLVLAALLLATFQGAAAQTGPPAPISQRVLDEVESGGQATFWVLMKEKADLGPAYGMGWNARGRFVHNRLRATALRSQAGLIDDLVRSGASHRSFWAVNTVRVTGDRALLDAIAARGDVEGIYPDEVIELPDPQPVTGTAAALSTEWGLDMIGAPGVWSTFGTRGEGIVVANIDTGVQFDHPALVAQYRGNLGGGSFDHNYNWHDPSRICPSATVPCDNNDHGTHTMGTMVGDDGATNQIGVAPGARWIAAKGCEDRFCSSTALLSSAQWILAPTDLSGQNPRPDLRPHVVNNSWGGGGGRSWYQASVDAWQAAGIIPVFSAGNSGPGSSTIGTPGDYCNVIGVGATNALDQVAGFSSRGPGDFPDCTDKPDVSAPGVDVRSSVAGNGYANFQGTSMAAPHVAGCTALLLSIAPELTYAEIYDLFTTTGVDLGPAGFDFDFGYGRINCLAAANQLRPDFTLEADPASLAVCLPEAADVNVGVVARSGFAEAVTLAASGVPGYGASFSVNPVIPGGSSLLTLAATGSPTAGSFTLQVDGTSTPGTRSVEVPVSLFADAPGVVALVAPAHGEVVDLQPTLSWSAAPDALEYLLEVADDSSFANLIYSVTTTETTHRIPAPLPSAATHYWRVTASNACGAAPAPETFSFTTASVTTVCQAPGLPIPDNDPAGVTDSIVLADLGIVRDLDVALDASHTWVGDLVFTLQHVETGSSAALIHRPGSPASTHGCSSDHVAATIDDEGLDGAAETACSATPPAIAGRLIGGDPPNAGLLALFDGENTAGTWTLRVSDHVGGDLGTLNEWCLTAQFEEPSEPPVAADDHYDTDEDAILNVPAPGVLVNDSDPEDDPLVANLLLDVAQGSLALQPDGSFSYSPDPDSFGVDQFSYEACDPAGGCSSATVTLTVNPVNDPPVAVDDTASTPEDTPISVHVAANDSDVDGNLDPASATVVTGPAHGSVVNDGDGSFGYTPDPDFNGSDGFSYFICDADGLCDEAAVGITIASVDDAPVANDDAATTDEDTAVTVDAAANDTDVDGNLDPASATVVSSPGHGSVVNNGDGSFEYTPDPNHNGADSFAYRICDTDGLCDTATVELTVNPVNDRPVAGDDATTTLEDTAVDVDVSANDSDVDGDLDPTSATLVSGPADGAVVNNGDGSFRYAPDPDFNGSDGFSYRICDSGGLCDEATVAITIIPVNDPPVVALSPVSQTVQYSDALGAIQVLVTDVDSASVITFIGGMPAGLSSTLPATCTGAGSVSCAGTISGALGGAAAMYTVQVSASDGDLSGSAQSSLSVTTEDASASFDNPVAVQVSAPGGDAAFAVQVFVEETEPDAGALTAPGDISLAQVIMTLIPIGPGGPVTGVCAPDGTSGVGYDQVLTATCLFSAVPVNTYTALVEVAGDYYSGSEDDVLTVYDPSLGFTTGGGWFYWPGTSDRTNFGYTMRYGRKGSNPKGSLLLIRHRPDGSKYRLKSNALEGLALGEEAGFGWASFSGKATYQEPGWPEPEGNHSFTVYVEDVAEPGAGADRLWIEARDRENGVLPDLSMTASGSDNAETLVGGNVVVPHGGGGKER